MWSLTSGPPTTLDADQIAMLVSLMECLYSANLAASLRDYACCTGTDRGDRGRADGVRLPRRRTSCRSLASTPSCIAWAFAANVRQPRLFASYDVGPSRSVVNRRRDPLLGESTPTDEVDGESTTTTLVARDERGKIRIRGARTHNLQGVDVDIPQHELTVVSGLSGSGKSSLALDTLLAEGQRQYVESLSVYSRQFFEKLRRPEVDVIEGLQPTVAIDQHAVGNNPEVPSPR